MTFINALQVTDSILAGLQNGYESWSAQQTTNALLQDYAQAVDEYGALVQQYNTLVLEFNALRAASRQAEKTARSEVASLRFQLLVAQHNLSKKK